MLRGYRSIVVALIGLILLGAGPPKPDGQEPPPATTNKIELTLRDIATALNKANEPSQLEQPCEEGDDQRNSDLCAQWKAADAAQSSALAAWILGSLGGLIGAFTLAAAWSAAKWAKKAAKETERSAVAAETALAEARNATSLQLRPYVAITEHPDDDAPKPFSRDSILKIRVVNFGQTPATNVRFSVGGAVAERPIGDYVVPLDKSGDYGAIAPGDCRTEKIHARDLTPADFGVIASGKDHMLARIRVDYTWPGGADHHDLTMILTDPATSEWNLLTDDRRRYTNDDKRRDAEG